jgi:acetate kinase
VHGGDKYFESVIIDQNVIADLNQLKELAPLHEPVSIIAIECVTDIFEDIKQIAVFDTAFHATMPEASKIYPLPYEWYQKYKIHRFGFHGISHQYGAKQAALILEKPLDKLNVLVCHLGNGASLCAVSGGKSVFTTMGFTPMDGIAMGTRSGSIDPGILTYLLKNKKLTIEQIETALNEDSGVKGICNVSDMQEVERLFLAGNERAKLAIEIYTQKLAGSIAYVYSYMEHVDALVFTGGVGENSALIRETVCKRLAFTGLQLDSNLNQDATADCFISSKQSSANVLVIQSKEDLSIAEECLCKLSAST